MLIEFSVANFWSFKEMQTLQMRAAKTVSKFPNVDIDNVISINEKLSILKSKAIYGANASGKTNLIRAFMAFRITLKSSLKDSEALSKWIVPFLLDDETASNPSFFQIVFIYDGIIFRYGFEATAQMITSEWLFGKKISKQNTKERYYFTREGMEVKVNEKVFKEGKLARIQNKDQVPLYRDNSLYLSVVAAWNGQLAKDLITYLNNSTILSGLNINFGANYFLKHLDNLNFKERITKLLKAIDPTVLHIEKIGANGFADIILYRKNSFSDKEIPFRLLDQEAEGTKKFLSVISVVLGVLELGDVIFIDELEATMHPNLTRTIIEIFNSTANNPNNAQLIFVTHDTNLLDSKLLRRDQISFAKKGTDGATELYSLIEFKGVRNDASFEKDYLMGKYEAVPTNLNMVAEAVQPYRKNAKEDKSS